jgi:hypothetical protein
LDEDGAHLFLKCKVVIAVWKELELEDIRQRMCSYQHAGAMLEEIMKLDKKKQISVCCLLWRWWTRRNKINHHEKVGELTEVIGQIRYWVTESETFYTPAVGGQVSKRL